MPQSKKKFVIWDFDGVIADSMAIWTTCASDFLRRKGYEDIHNIDTLQRPKGLIETAQCLKQYYDLPFSVQEIFDDINAYVGEQYRSTIRHKRCVRRLLRDMHEAGLKMCIATATDAEFVRAALKRWGYESYFEFIITCDDVGCGKSSAKIFLEAASKLGADPSECIIIEDGLIAIRTASSAGFCTIGVYEPSVSDRAEDMREL